MTTTKNNLNKVIGLNTQLLTNTKRKIALELDRKWLSGNILAAANHQKCIIMQRFALKCFNNHSHIIARSTKEMKRITARIEGARVQLQECVL